MSVLPYPPPLTRPVFFQYSQAWSRYPPLQPLPQPPLKMPWQQVISCCADTMVWVPLWMQILSEMAPEAPTAQHDPQLAWSQTVLMELQLDHSSRESKDSGAAIESVHRYNKYNSFFVIFYHLQ